MWLEKQVVRAVLGVIVLLVIGYFAYNTERRMRRLLKKRMYQYALVLFAGGGLPPALRYLHSQGISIRKGGARLQRLVRFLGIGAAGMGPFGQAILTTSGAGPPTADDDGILMPSQPSEPVHCCGHILYQPDDVLRHRADDSDGIGAWMKSADQAVEEFAGFFQLTGQALTLTGVVRPGRQSRFWLDFLPDDVPAKMKQGLMERLSAIKPPPVHGPVAFLSHLLLWGGPQEYEELFSFVPHDWLAPIGILPDDPLKKVWPA